MPIEQKALSDFGFTDNRDELLEKGYHPKTIRKSMRHYYNDKWD